MFVEVLDALSEASPCRRGIGPAPQIQGPNHASNPGEKRAASHYPFLWVHTYGREVMRE